MSSLPFWYDDKGGSEWDRFQLGKHVLPGAWKVECTCERDIEVKKSKGKDGARMDDHGYEPAAVTFTGQFTADADWQAMQKILPDLHPRKKGGPRSEMHAQHPTLAVMGVVNVYLKAIKAPVIDDRGILTLAIEAIEYVAPAPTKKKKLTEFKLKFQQGSTVIEVPFNGVLAGSPVGAFIDASRNMEQGLEALSKAPDEPVPPEPHTDEHFLRDFDKYKQLQ